jgi:hypothetical protein
MEKLKSRKAEVDEQLDRSRGTTASPETASPLFPTTPPAGPIGEPLLEGTERKAWTRPAAQVPGLASAASEPEKLSYTNRLLKAKQRVWEEREKDQDKETKP